MLIPEGKHENVFWKSPLSGAKKAAAEMSHYGIEIKYFLFDLSDTDSFISQANKALLINPDGLAFAPVHYEESLNFIKKIKEQGVPFVLINSVIKDSEFLSYIGQDSVQSGYLSAKLLSLGLESKDGILIVNVSRKLSKQKHILGRNTGFKNYFLKTPELNYEIYTLDIEDTSQSEVNRQLSNAFKKNKNIKAIYVSSSRVYKVAKYLKKTGKKVRIIGYDLIQENVTLLKEGIIDFLISQKPIDQGYFGVMALINHVVLKKGFKKEFYLPIDIITAENIQYYDY